MAEKVEIKITVDKQTGAISVAGEELKGLGKSADEASGKLFGLSGSVGKVASELAGVLSAGAVAAFFKQSVEAASQMEDAVNKLNNALANNGQFTPEVSRDLQELAAQLQRTTKFSDDTVISAQSLLATFGLNAEQIKKATQAAADLSAVMGTDLQSSAALLTRAFQGNEGALSRLGIKINENVPAAQRFDAILTAISEKMGGRAQADANTFSGRLAQLKHAFEDVQKEVGNAFLPMLEDLISFLQSNMDTFRNFFAGVVFAAQAGAAGFSNGITVMKNSFMAFIDTAVTGWQVYNAATKLNLKEVGELWKGLSERNKARLDETVAASEEANKKINESFEKNIMARINGEAIAQTRINDQIKNGQAQRRVITDEEIKQAEEAAKKKTAIIEKQLANDLARFNQTSQEKMALVNAAEFQEASLQLQLLDQKLITEQEYNSRIATMHEEFTARRTQINQRFSEDTVAANEAWFANATNLYARFNELGRKTLDNFTQSIGDAFAKQILHGKSFAEQFNALWNNIKEQVVSAIAAMIAKLIALRIAQAAVGFGTGGIGGGLISRLFEKGGRTAGLKRVRKLAGGGRTSGPELAIIGEGRDDESVVPDGQAMGFAMGVAAARGGGRMSGSAEGQGKVVNPVINITINSVDLSDRAVTQRLARDLADMVLSETEEGIRLARRIGDVNDRFQGRSV